LLITSPLSHDLLIFRNHDPVRAKPGKLWAWGIYHVLSSRSWGVSSGPGRGPVVDDPYAMIMGLGVLGF
jgi:hypothetical protein